MTDTKPRLVLYVDETMQTPNGYIPSAVEEGIAGHSPMMGRGEFAEPWYFGPTIEEAKKQVDEFNAKLGIDPNTARDIVLSSMTASIREDAARRTHEERYDALRGIRRGE